MVLAVMFMAMGMAARGDDGRAGSVEWSDGHTLAGAISLTPGKALRVFTATSQVAFSLAEVKEMRFTPEKEEMREGFYFPNAGQATQTKTGEVYPVRYLQTQVTLANGQSVEGHLFTTTLYVESDDGTQKVVLMAKQTGADGQKLADLAYPMLIRFDADAGAPGGTPARVDLTQAGLVPRQAPVFVVRPDLTAPPVAQTAGKPVWTLPADAGQLLFSVEAADGIHVAWPKAAADPAVQASVEGSLKVMQDFYDTRTLLGCFSDGDGCLFAGDDEADGGVVWLQRGQDSVEPGGAALEVRRGREEDDAAERGDAGDGAAGGESGGAEGPYRAGAAAGCFER